MGYRSSWLVALRRRRGIPIWLYNDYRKSYLSKILIRKMLLARTNAASEWWWNRHPVHCYSASDLVSRRYASDMIIYNMLYLYTRIYIYIYMMNTTRHDKTVYSIWCIAWERLYVYIAIRHPCVHILFCIIIIVLFFRF